MEPQTPQPTEQPDVNVAEVPAAETAPTPAPEMATPAPASQASTTSSATNPGHGLGVAGLILAFFAPLVGLILSIMAKSKSKKAGMSNGMAVAGIIISAINMVISGVVVMFMVIGAAKIASVCADEGSGTHYIDGVTYTCE